MPGLIVVLLAAEELLLQRICTGRRTPEALPEYVRGCSTCAFCLIGSSPDVEGPRNDTLGYSGGCCTVCFGLAESSSCNPVPIPGTGGEYGEVHCMVLRSWFNVRFGSLEELEVMESKDTTEGCVSPLAFSFLWLRYLDKVRRK